MGVLRDVGSGRGADFARGADGGGAAAGLLRAVGRLVQVEHDVRALRDEQPRLNVREVEALLAQVLHLREQVRQVHHHAVPCVFSHSSGSSCRVPSSGPECNVQS